MGKISQDQDIFGKGSDSETEIKTENQYAKNYDVWRKKEEFNKLKTKYGDNVLDGSESSSSSDDDEDAAELTEEVKKDFFKTLSYLKKKDPKIYDNSVSFFKPKDGDLKKEKKVKEQPLYLKDYERQLLLEKRGILSDEEDEPNSRPLTYVKEQEDIKNEILKVGAHVGSDDEEDGKLGGMLALRQKTKEENIEKEAEYVKWLTGQTDEIQDDEIKSELKPLKDFWNDPKLDSGEKFLRDYVLKKRYLGDNEDNYVPTYDEIVHDSDQSLSGDEEEIEKQEEFEHKYNFRFEEPDQEFIKRYPRTIEQSLRKTDDRRKQKRVETKERKLKEKEEKMADIRKLQELKRKEIEEKIEKLKEVTGATDMTFQDDDIDGDFDPEAYDKRMQSLFSDDFYEGPENDQKPEFPDIDEELEIENWDHWDGKEVEGSSDQPHCEDDNFIMDADYNPSTSTKEELIENSKGKKKRKRKSKVAEALGRPKPKYDPSDKNYEKYFDEYYKLDCEDIIGDIPCRFKYREVVPNDFGLTVEEILLAKDKELNRWCSLKKTVQRRPDNIEKYDQIAYSKKANNIVLKQKLLPSLFSNGADEDQLTSTEPSTSSNNNTNVSTTESKTTPENDPDDRLVVEDKSEPLITESKKRKKKKTNKEKKGNIDNNTASTNENTTTINSVESENLTKNELKDSTEISEPVEGKSEPPKTENKKRKKKKNKKKKQGNTGAESVQTETNKNSSNQSEEGKSESNTTSENPNQKKDKKRKRVDSDINKNGGKKAKKSKEPNIAISDARLSAFGINPKKYKNKLKYGNKKST